jgi:adiponectin receptor
MKQKQKKKKKQKIKYSLMVKLFNIIIKNNFKNFKINEISLDTINTKINQNEIKDSKNPKDLIKEYIGNVTEAHNFIIDNEFILKGYRINFHSCKRITKSACMCHNETVNIWTHFIGFVLVVTFIIMVILEIGPINPNNFIKNESLKIRNLSNNNNNIFNFNKKKLLEEKPKKISNEKNEENFSKNINESLDINYFSSIFKEEQDKIIIPRWPVLIQLLSALFCLGCSTIFHLFSAYSKKVGNILNRLDYAGISILVAGSCFPVCYYMFFCSKGN